MERVPDELRVDHLVHDDHRDVRVDDDPERIDDAGDERRRARRRVDAEALHDDREHRPDRAARHDDADEGHADREGEEKVLIGVHQHASHRDERRA